MRGGKVRMRGNYRRSGAETETLHSKFKNLTVFQYFNKGCFFKRYDSYCSSRLTDYYCVIWTNLTETQNIENNEVEAVKNDTFVSKSQQLLQIEECGGDFNSEAILNLNTYLLPIFIILGTFGNFISCYLTSRMAGKQLPTCYYLSILSIVDLLILFIRAGDLWMQSAAEIYINFIALILSREFCQLYSAFYTFLLHFKGALQIALAIDTWRLIRRPIQTIRVYTSEWVRNSVILACVLLLPLNSQFIWTFDVVRQNAMKKTDRSYFCGFAVKWSVDERFSAFMWPLTDLLAGDILPVLIVSAFVAFSFVSILKSRQQTVSETDNDGVMDKYILNVKLFLQTRRAMLAISIIYFSLFFPTIIHDVAMYTPFAQAQWKIISSMFSTGKLKVKEKGFSFQSYINKGKQLIPKSMYSHQEAEARVLFIKMLFFLQLVAQPLVMAVFVEQYKQNFLGILTLRKVRQRHKEICSTRSGSESKQFCTR